MQAHAPREQPGRVTRPSRTHRQASTESSAGDAPQPRARARAHTACPYARGVVGGGGEVDGEHGLGHQLLRNHLVEWTGQEGQQGHGDDGPRQAYMGGGGVRRGRDWRQGRWCVWHSDRSVCAQFARRYIAPCVELKRERATRNPHRAGGGVCEAQARGGAADAPRMPSIVGAPHSETGPGSSVTRPNLELGSGRPPTVTCRGGVSGWGAKGEGGGGGGACGGGGRVRWRWECMCVRGGGAATVGGSGSPAPGAYRVSAQLADHCAASIGEEQVAA